MLVKYYHLRNEKGEPRLTRCIVKLENEFGIGSALCSLSDFPNKKVGRKIAFNRAIHALERQKDVLPISRDEAFDVIDDVEYALYDLDELDERLYYKGYYTTDKKYLNLFEKKLFLSKESVMN